MSARTDCKRGVPATPTERSGRPKNSKASLWLSDTSLPVLVSDEEAGDGSKIMTGEPEKGGLQRNRGGHAGGDREDCADACDRDKAALKLEVRDVILQRVGAFGEKGCDD
jgi:hypothetical protein